VIVEALTTLALAAPARVQVGADEFRYTLSRLSIKAGPAIVQLANFGEDEHDLRLRRAGGTRTYAIGTTGPGKVAELEARFRAGRFTLWCSLADHRRRGMSATLVVRR
jgi:plastocyanin